MAPWRPSWPSRKNRNATATETATAAAVGRNASQEEEEIHVAPQHHDEGIHVPPEESVEKEEEKREIEQQQPSTELSTINTSTHTSLGSVGAAGGRRGLRKNKKKGLATATPRRSSAVTAGLRQQGDKKRQRRATMSGIWRKPASITTRSLSTPATSTTTAGLRKNANKMRRATSPTPATSTTTRLSNNSTHASANAAAVAKKKKSRGLSFHSGVSKPATTTRSVSTPASSAGLGQQGHQKGPAIVASAASFPPAITQTTTQQPGAVDVVTDPQTMEWMTNPERTKAAKRKEDRPSYLRYIDASWSTDSGNAVAASNNHQGKSRAITANNDGNAPPTTAAAITGAFKSSKEFEPLAEENQNNVNNNHNNEDNPNNSGNYDGIFSSLQQLPPEQTNNPDMDESTPGAFRHGWGMESETSISWGQCNDTQRSVPQQHPPHQPATLLQERVNNTDGLAVAHMIDEESIIDPESLMEAQQINIEMLQKEQQKKKYKMIGCFVVVLLCFITILAVSLGLLLGRSNEESLPIPSSPTIHPSTAPSKMPSSSPTGALDLLEASLPEYTLDSLESLSTPQWKAMDWISGHPEISIMEEWRKKQLFALATFYYSMKGEHWPQIIQDNWLVYDESECYWFDTISGRFNPETGEWDPGAFGYTPGLETPCNHSEIGNYIHLALNELGLEEESAGGSSPKLPPEVSLLSSLERIVFLANGLNTDISDFLPSSLYQMENLTYINLVSNGLTGSIPTEFGRMVGLESLALSGNPLTGSIPSQLGLLTRLQDLTLFRNELTGQLPTELGMIETFQSLYVADNALTGSIPTQFGKMTSLSHLSLANNEVTGTIPTELALPTNLIYLSLNDNKLTGTIPSELEVLATNLYSLELANNSLSGTVPKVLCSLVDMSFDCNDQLCGCCWCPCPGVNNSTGDCHNDAEWPGRFPTPVNNRTNSITINVRTDKYPDETSFTWRVLNDELGSWEVVDIQNATNSSSLHSYTYQLSANSLYHLEVWDSAGDGTCCDWGKGWFTITNSTGLVIWEASGDAWDDISSNFLDVYVRTDRNGNAQLAEY